MDPIAEANAKVAEHRRVVLEDLLRDMADFLEPYEDADLVGDSYRPNKAMSLRARILAELA